jgi:hypothetical protein
MDVLLIMAILVLLLGVLAWAGAVRFLQAGAWLILVIGVLMLALFFVL